ncbi:hypothetical protein [Haloterrigena salinisoli]|uniref:hypothetical protein n=1 Tax=Haloterrigena salinisoli TaxID=3132747 RepID=UPI0030D1A9F4
MPRIPAVVSDDHKTRWNDHVEDDPALDSVSDLVRTAVEEYIADESSASGALNDEDVADMLDTLDRIDSRLSDVDHGIDRLHRRTVTEDDCSEEPAR